ncbi:MAG: hypothetical protein HY238_15715 [Acidobacteria bacterium]|nr:hypothetical protein [Acidobacteriota bacterium]
MRGVSLRLCVILLVVPVFAEDAAELFSQGLQAYSAEKYEGAIQLFEGAAAAAPSVSRYEHWLGKAYWRRAERVIFIKAGGLAKKAKTAFERAVELDPENEGALTDLLDYYLSAPAILGGGEDKARGIAARLAKISAAEGHRAQALLLAKRKDYAGAEREYRQALELEPAKLGRLLDLASFLNERGRHAEADALFDQAAKRDSQSPEYLFARGQQLASSKRNPQRARELLEQYLRSPRGADDPPPSEVQALLRKL